MTDQQRTFWHINRIVGPILFFAVLGFVLYKYAELSPLISFGIAAFAAASDFFVLTWLMNRMDASDDH